jgi:two-component system, OmpR family, response regulator
MRILYIEDNADDANLVHRYVRTTPHELVIVDTLEDAYTALSEPVDLVLVDVLLHQQRSGYTLARALRDKGLNHPIVAVTALTTPSDIEAARRAGFDEVLTKPYPIHELAEMIHRYVG